MSGEGYMAKTQKFLQELSFEYTFLYGKQSDPSDFGINRGKSRARSRFRCSTTSRHHCS